MRHTRHRFQEWLVVGGVLVVLAASLPLLAVLALVGRAVLVAAAIVALAGGVIAYLWSPRFREWFSIKTALQFAYKGLRLATDVAVHPSHSWVRIEPHEVKVGADDLVQTVLGPVEAIDTPPVGSRVQGGDRLVRLWRGDRSVELRSPVSGTVLGTNEELREHPWLINEEPFSKGWAVRIRGDNLRADRRRLLRGKEAQDWFCGEVDRLIETLQSKEAFTPGLADGGALVAELYLQIDDDAWKRLTQNFFGMERGIPPWS